MVALLNIAKTDEKPLYVDPSDVTAVNFDPEKGELSVSNSQGQFLFINAAKWGVDVTDLVQKLEDSGNPLLSFPLSANGKEYVRYISPRAVTFATVSQTAEDGKVGVVMGVKGAGRQDTWDTGIKQEEFDAIIDAVRAAKPLLEYAPEEARSRWSSPAGLYLDPQSVTRIQDDGHYQVIVRFEGAGDLDIKVKEVDINTAAREIPNFQELAKAQGIDKVFEQAARRQEDLNKRARMDFASGLAAGNDKLIPFITEDRAVYLAKGEASHVVFRVDDKNGDRVLQVHTQPNETYRYGETVQLRFKTDAARLKAFAALNPDAAAAAPKKAKAPKPKL